MAAVAFGAEGNRAVVVANADPPDESLATLGSLVSDKSTSARTDGRLQYHAERATDNPGRVVFYWLELSDAAIFAPPGQRASGGVAP